jgi:hypothetical protein
MKERGNVGGVSRQNLIRVENGAIPLVPRIEKRAWCASPKFYAHYESRDSLPRRLARPGYPFTLERQESLPEERPRGIPVYIKDGGMRTFSRR